MIFARKYFVREVFKPSYKNLILYNVHEFVIDVRVIKAYNGRGILLPNLLLLYVHYFWFQVGTTNNIR